MPMKPQIGRQGMRRLCALFLLLLSVGPWLLALSPFHATAEALLPACCRSHGKHKCFIRLSGEGSTASTSGAVAVSQVSERCPYNPARTNTTHNGPFGQPAEDVRWAGHSSAASLVAIATRRCISFLSRANCKRGPPSPDLSLKATTDRLAAREVAISLETRCFDEDRYFHPLL
jgi:hypothetical protein